MKKEFYYLATGMIFAIGMVTMFNSFYPFPEDFWMVVASALYVGYGLSLWMYDDEIKRYLGVIE